jgi:hypothetical protein
MQTVEEVSMPKKTLSEPIKTSRYTELVGLRNMSETKVANIGCARVGTIINLYVNFKGPI